MSPEQLTGLPLDGRSDIYAVGLTLYEMVTGRRAVPGENNWAVMQAQMQTQPPAPAEVNGAVPADLSAAIMRAIAKHPEQRFQAAAQLSAALAGVHAPPTDPAPWRSAAPARAPSAAVLSAAPAGAGTTLPPGTLFGAPAALERVLAEFLGPFARHVVRKAVAGCTSVQELCRRLAAEIADPAERRAFLRACAHELGADALSDTARLEIEAARTAPSPDRPAWDPALLDRARLELAAHVGPLARVIVERAAARARDLTELYSMLAAEITSERDRQTFLARTAKGAT
jgi:serine/threonine-protein kinase